MIPLYTHLGICLSRYIIWESQRFYGLEEQVNGARRRGPAPLNLHPEIEGSNVVTNLVTNHGSKCLIVTKRVVGKIVENTCFWFLIAGQ